MADPVFPIGGVDPLGGVDLQRGHFSVKMYVKTKDLGPVGRRASDFFVRRSTTAILETSR